VVILIKLFMISPLSFLEKKLSYVIAFSKDEGRVVLEPIIINLPIFSYPVL
jgi:hypothetical protein